MNKHSNSLQDGGSGSGSRSNKRQLGTGVDQKVAASSRKKVCSESLRGEVKERSSSFSRNDRNTSVMDLLQEGKHKTPAAAAPAPGQGLAAMGLSVTEEVGVTFPERLMELVMNETDKEALWWLPGGNSFAIHSKKFTKTILAQNFQGSKFESFTRKLARWGFKRLSGSDTPPPHTFHYQHPYFRKDKPELAKEISGNKKKLAAMVAQEEQIPRQQSTGSTSSSLNKASAPMASPGPAPWPTVTEHEQQQQLRDMDGSCTISTSAAAQYKADTSNHQLQQQQARDARAGTDESFSSASGQVLRQDLEMQLLLRSMASSSPQLSQQQEAAQAHAAALLAEQDRRMSLLSGLIASPAAQPASVAQLSAASASLNIPSLTSRIPGERASAALNLSDLLQGNLSSDSNNRAISTTVLRASSSSSRPIVFQQHQQQQATRQASPSFTVAASDTNHLVRLYLQQQQQANRREALLMQRNEALQEILRRQRQGPPF